MSVLAVLGELNCIALENVGRFARAAGFSSVGIIAKALIEVPMFPWMEIIPGIQQRPTRLQTNINGVKSYVRAPEVTEELHLDGAITLRQDNLTVGMNLTKLRAEGTIFKEQCDYISAHPFGGFRTDAGQGRRMGTLVFLARSSLVKVNEDSTVTGYAGGGQPGWSGHQGDRAAHYQLHRLMSRTEGWHDRESN